MEYNLDQIMNLMNDCFLDEGSLNRFIIGSFYSTFNKLRPGLPLSDRISDFVVSVHQDRAIPKLLEKLKDKYPRVYEEFEPKLGTADTSASTVEIPKPNSQQPAPQSESKDNEPGLEMEIYDILVLAANHSTQKLQLDEEIKLIKKEAKNYTVKILPKVLIEDLSKYLEEYDPIILHFSGHGNFKSEIILNDRQGHERVLPIEELAKLLPERVECVVLNACFSGDKVDALIKKVSCVIGMRKEIEDKSALKFSEGFYRGIGLGKSYQDAFALGISQIGILELPDGDVPHFIRRDASVLDLKPTKKRSTSERVEQDLPIYPLWFGTNRKPVNSQDISQGFSGERDNQLHYGNCKVIVPKSHNIGSIGSPQWKKLTFKFTDDNLKLQSDSLKVFNETDFWSNVKITLQQDQSKENYALIYIHGYNVSFQAAALRAAQLGCDLDILPGRMAFYSWPSKAKLDYYTADEAAIEASEKYISKFLMDWVQKTEIQKVHIIAHSMGNRGLLRGMWRIFDQVQTKSQVSFGQIILAAPDVDADLFKDLVEAYRNLAERTTIYVSSKDKALQSSEIIHDYPRLGFYSPTEEITVIEGEKIDTVSVSNIDLTLLGHGYYSDSRPVLADIYYLLTDNKSPNERFGLESVTVVNQRHWIFRK